MQAGGGAGDVEEAVQAGGGATFGGVSLGSMSGGAGSTAGGVGGLGGETGNVGGVSVAWAMDGAGVARRGDTKVSSRDDAGVEGSEPVACNMDDGGVATGGVGGLDRGVGEMLSSSSSSWSRSNSSSFRRRLGFLAGGGSASGEGGGGVAGGVVEIADWGRSAPGSAATAGIVAEDGNDDGAGSSHAAVAARPRLRRERRRRRRLPAVLSVAAGTGMLHVTVKTWHPAACLIFTLAIRPLAMQS